MCDVVIRVCVGFSGSLIAVCFDSLSSFQYNSNIQYVCSRIVLAIVFLVWIFFVACSPNSCMKVSYVSGNIPMCVASLSHWMNHIFKRSYSKVPNHGTLSFTAPKYSFIWSVTWFCRGLHIFHSSGKFTCWSSLKNFMGTVVNEFKGFTVMVSCGCRVYEPWCQFFV